MHFEVHDVAPICHPFVQERAVFSLHHLVTDLQIFRDPNSYIGNAVGCEASLIAKATIDGNGVAVPEALDNEVEAHRIFEAKCCRPYGTRA